MKNYYLLFSVLFFCSFTNAQNSDLIYQPDIKDQLIIKSNHKYENKYFYQNKLYKKRHIHRILKQDPLAWNHYKKYKGKKGEARIYYGASVGLFFASYMVALGDWRTLDDNETPTKSSERTAAALFFSSVAMTGLGIRTSIVSRKNFDKSIDYFNGNIINKAEVGFIPIELDLQYAKNGVGLVLNF